MNLMYEFKNVNRLPNSPLSNSNTEKELLGSVYTKRRDCDCDVASDIALN